MLAGNILHELIIYTVNRYHAVPSLCIHTTGRCAHMKLFMVVMSVLTIVAKFTVGPRIDAFHADFPAYAVLAEAPVRIIT